ncbi:hypothetical protein K3169_26780 [Pseudomonas phytophila]|uniref:Phage holin family protein n=1 Tax=Pseudomonas phytophila TaxID=2867264 RepID=A0ABY6FDD2_9PSED|nr:hypothetical protein [Pseudomonas phytophila]UXZ95866.1 hypothetical protein K3169_26780 [Pseudomonas phytophila]
MKHTGPTSELFDELNELVDLAEQSAKAIDELVERLDGARLRVLLNVVVLYALLISLGYFAFYSGSDYSISSSWKVASTAFGMVVVGGSLSLLYSYFLRMRKTSRDLRVEQDIHNRLMSLIDGQKRRMDADGYFSAVAEATFSIRLRRLDRTDRKST